MEFDHSQLFKSLTCYYEHILFRTKLYLIKRSIADTQSTSINWYIIIFILSSLILKVINILEKRCSCVESSGEAVQFSLLPRIEKRLQDFIECYFNECLGTVYIATLTICDVLVISAVLIQNHNHLVYPWLITTAIILICEIIFILIDFIHGCEPSLLDILIFVHVSYSWFYIYMWGSMVYYPCNK